MKRKPTINSASRTLTVRPQENSQDQADARQDREDTSRVEQKIAKDKAADKIGTLFDHAAFDVDQTPAQVFGMAVIDSVGGDVARLPRWRFSRWYFGIRTIVDLFHTKSEYKEAQVEDRRKMAHKFGFKYGALGPGMSYVDDLPAQLGI